MTDKEAIEELKDLLRAFGYSKENDTADYNYLRDDEPENYKTAIAIETVLNLIQTQQKEIEERNRALDIVNREKADLLEEIKKKDKRTSDLEFALMDMVLQFADENKDCISTMGLSALEIAFNELDFANPMSIKEVHKRYKKLAQKYYE